MAWNYKPKKKIKHGNKTHTHTATLGNQTSKLETNRSLPLPVYRLSKIDSKSKFTTV